MRLFGSRVWDGIAITALAALAWALAFAIIERSADRLERDAFARARVTADALEQLMLRTIDGVDAQLGLVILRERMARAQDTVGAEDLARLLVASASASRFGVVQGGFAGVDGWTTWVMRGSRVFIGDREHFQVHTQTPRDLFISKPVLGRASGQVTAQFSRALLDDRGALSGVAITSLDLIALSSQLADFNHGAYDVATVLRPDGIVLARSRDGAATMGSDKPTDPSLLLRAQDKQTGEMQSIDPLDGRRRFLAFRRVRGRDLIVSASFDRDEELASLSSVRVTAFLAAGLVTALLGLFVIAVALRAGRRRALEEVSSARSNERAAGAARSEIDSLLAGMPTAVYRGTLGDDGTFTVAFVSDNVVAITGRTAQDVSGREVWYGPVRDINPGEVEGFFERVVASGEAELEYPLARGGEGPGAQRFWIRDRARLAGHTREGAEIVGNWSDISRERALSEQAIETAKLATLGELATGLAHELNQPIAVMSLAAENADDALADGVAGIDDARVRLARIVEQAGRAKNIVRHLRIFGRADSGQLEPVSLAEAVSGALVLVGNLLRAACVRVTVRLPPDMPTAIGRMILIQQVLVNLCANARDSMIEVPFDDRELFIDGGAAAFGEVELTVRHTGARLGADVLERLFDPYTADRAAAHGLGLAISHGMMHSMLGRLTARDEPAGTTLVLTFRAAAAPQERFAELTQR